MKMKRFWFWLIGAAITLSFSTVSAGPIEIVAFGGSNTFGKNLRRSDAYPAQLETQLRANGYDVLLRNEGMNGQTTADELGKVNSILSDNVRIVIFQPGGNDRRKAFAITNTKENIEKIVQRLLDRKVLVIFSGNAEKRGFVEKFNILTINEISHLAPNDLQADGEHLTAKGYAIVASEIRPLVEKLLSQISTLNVK